MPSKKSKDILVKAEQAIADFIRKTAEARAADGVSMSCGLGQTVFTAPKKKSTKPLTAGAYDGQESIGSGCSIRNTRYSE